MILRAFEEARMDRDAEAVSQRAYGVWAALVPVFLVALTWGGLVLVGAWMMRFIQ